MRERFHRIWNKFTSIRSNLQVLEEWANDIARLGKNHQALLAHIEMNETLRQAFPKDELASYKKLDIAFISEDLPALIRESSTCLDILKTDLMSIHRQINSTLSVSLSTPNKDGDRS